MTYSKISELTAASALAGTEVLPVVQSSATVKVTPAQIKTYVDGTGITATSVITGEYQLTEDNELDYSASFTDGMSAATVTFSELPSNTKAVWVFVQLSDTGTAPHVQYKRSSGGTLSLNIFGEWADAGTNVIALTPWMPTGGNSIYVEEVAADTALIFKIIGYKTGQ